LKNTITNLNKNPIDEIEKALYNINMSTRQIKKSYISCTGYFASYKNKTQIAFESVLERDFYMMMEFDDKVISYEEQPMTIHYEYYDGKNRRYTPDTLVTYKDKMQKLIEVKYDDELKNDLELQRKLQLLAKHIKKEQKINFEVYTDKFMDKQLLLNYKFLYNFVFIPNDTSKTETINRILNNTNGINVKDLLQKLNDNKIKQLQYLPYIWNYIFHNIHVIDRFKKLTMKTILEKKVRI
jgi:hypothetical protein